MISWTREINDRTFYYFGTMHDAAIHIDDYIVLGGLDGDQYLDYLESDSLPSGIVCDASLFWHGAYRGPMYRLYAGSPWVCFDDGVLSLESYDTSPIPNPAETDSVFQDYRRIHNPIMVLTVGRLSVCGKVGEKYPYAIDVEFQVKAESTYGDAYEIASIRRNSHTAIPLNAAQRRRYTEITGKPIYDGKPSHVYVLALSNGYTKIGKGNDVGGRVSAIREGLDADLVILDSFQYPTEKVTFDIESMMHRRYKAERRRMQGDGGSEVFELTDSQVADVLESLRALELEFMQD